MRFRLSVDSPPARDPRGRRGIVVVDLGWTRDPFDRLIVAHAVRRGWRLATGDEALLARLPASRVVRL